MTVAKTDKRILALHTTVAIKRQFKAAAECHACESVGETKTVLNYH
jgi:hypothetical protein